MAGVRAKENIWIFFAKNENINLSCIQVDAAVEWILIHAGPHQAASWWVVFVAATESKPKNGLASHRTSQ
jgi:hypothetical protein